MKSELATLDPPDAADQRVVRFWQVRDLVGALCVSGAGLALFVSTLSGQPGLGDGPETVSGVKTLGILHAPGYPSYAIAARLWATIAPFGSWALRVNVFSAVCSAVAVGLLFVLCRQFGANRPAAALGALAAATSVSFWSNAGFAKHYGFSAMLVVLAAVLVLEWERAGGTRTLVAAGVVVGVGTGASWELMAIMALGLVALVVFGARRITLREVGVVLGTALVVTVLVWSFVVVRANQDPEINWGRATTPGRLSDLVRQKDFLSGSAAPDGVRVLSDAPHRAWAYSTITAREVGLAAIALAVVGAVVVSRRKRWGETVFLAIVLLGNALGAIFVAGLEHDQGMHSGMVVGGFLIDVVIVLAVLIAVGTTWLADATARRVREDQSSVVRAVVVGAAAVLVLAPSVVVHRDYANHRVPNFADNYARRVLDKLPPDAILITFGWELGTPIRYRQIVYGERPDVLLFSNAETNSAWYREELAKRAPSVVPPADSPPAEWGSRVIERALDTGRPVYLDMSILGALGSGYGFQADGDVVRVTGDPQAPPVESVADASLALHEAQAADGWLGGKGARFPNRNIARMEVLADLLLAKIAVDAGQVEAAKTQLRDAVAIRPDLKANAEALRLLEANDPAAADAVFALTGES